MWLRLSVHVVEAIFDCVEDICEYGGGICESVGGNLRIRRRLSINVVRLSWNVWRISVNPKDEAKTGT